MSKSYKLFILKLVIFIAILAGVDFLVGKGMDYLRISAFERHPNNVGMKASFVIEKTTDDVLIIGASDASHHYIPLMIEDSIGMTVQNCGIDGSFFLFQNCLINLTLQRYSPKMIIWQFGPNYLTTSYDKYEHQNDSRLYPYYDDEYCNKILDEQSNTFWMKMKSGMYRNNSKLFDYVHGNFVEHHFYKGYVPIETLGYAYPSISHEIDTCSLSPKKIDILKKSIEFCNIKGVKLVFAIAPSLYSEGIYETPQYGKLLSIANEYEVPIIESRKYREYFIDPSLYKDVNHLNDNGAKLWMKYFIPELEEIVEVD